MSESAKLHRPLGNDNKNNFATTIFCFTSATPITVVSSHDPEIFVTTVSQQRIYFGCTFVSQKRGFGLPLSEDELTAVNEFRQREGRAALEATPGTRFLLPGKSMEGY